ncbi:MAG: hypothetical protein U0990_07500 [Candidatus Nanopelagicales bacterium]|nr:hypothetical protein [Candidatus Nanopelagicales bacterium]MDZ4249919.1 hypothetical protein [Candidatus Nanopelagicales bacterium]
MRSAETTVQVTVSGTAPRPSRAGRIGTVGVDVGHVVSLGYEGLALSDVLAEVASARRVGH